MNIVQIYAPTNDASDDDKDAFYSRLQGVIDKLPRKDVNIMMEDANAKIGQDNVGYEGIKGQHGLGQMNENGERFPNLCAFNSLVNGGSVFPHNKIHKATWAGFRKNRSTTDQIATLRIIMEQSLEWNSQLIINFLDYEKAFDSIDRATLTNMELVMSMIAKTLPCIHDFLYPMDCVSS
ncbi:uncharacterized protein LOC106012876 [Aplysia californica]|uniref:Uncharacterized protein LOC106012876 n=1 Tax=Aplysia californica TaxID=6500 RepID=A0ABM1A7V1_APLCA|nr:uncharacterized protein LOC106012876 [Aplysia californica]